MIQRDNHLSLIWGVTGLLLETAAVIPAAKATTQPILNYLAVALTIVGVVMLTIGMAYYARSRSRSPWWGLVGLIYVVGILILLMLKDRSPDAPTPRWRHAHKAMAITGVALIAAGMLTVFIPQQLFSQDWMTTQARHHPTEVLVFVSLCLLAIVGGALVALLGFAVHWSAARHGRGMS